MKRATVISIVAVIVIALLFASGPSFAQKAEKAGIIFVKNLRYDIYYVVSEFEVDTLRQVTVIGTAFLGNREFLVIRGPRSRSTPSVVNTDGYILADSIKAILPSEMAQPQREFRKD
jgi:hypothetical protein